MQPHEINPLDLLELKYIPDVWKVLVSCILLNKTRRSQVDLMIDELFARWPTAYHMSLASQADLTKMLGPLGLHNQRSRTLLKMSERFLELPEHPSYEQVARLTGVGRYAMEAYRILFLGDARFEPSDRVLKAYLRAKGEAA